MKQLMTHIVAGYPTLVQSEEIAKNMLEAGVGFLEIQIPFSDPVADGPTIMGANQVALNNGVTPEDCFEMMRRLSEGEDRHPRLRETHLLFMTYFNIPFRYGLERFCKRAKEVGCYGLIIPDIPLDEEPYEHYLELCKKYQLHAIQVISPITPVERLKKIGAVASGFVYCVARAGTTGVQKDLDTKALEYLDLVREHVKVPLAVGFGISNREHVEQVLTKADIAVIGSKIIQLAQSGGTQDVKSFLDSLN